MHVSSDRPACAFAKACLHVDPRCWFNMPVAMERTVSIDFCFLEFWMEHGRRRHSTRRYTVSTPVFCRSFAGHDPIEIQMRGIRWRVPRNFLESAEISDRSEDRARRINSASLRIVTTLSTLTGATPETLACYKALRAEVCPDTIIILTQWQAASADS